MYIVVNLSPEVLNQLYRNKKRKIMTTCGFEEHVQSLICQDLLKTKRIALRAKKIYQIMSDLGEMVDIKHI